ncbi:hypothetical protein TRVL_05492 [Trypanosoma vivax]|nr:hypothetical protein TRVL_05492 [Trypanosoma vivax]
MVVVVPTVCSWNCEGFPFYSFSLTFFVLPWPCVHVNVKASCRVTHTSSSKVPSAMKRIFNRFYDKTGLISDPSRRSVASRVSATLVNGAVVFSVLGTLGVDMSPLIATAGVAAATIGFACKDFGSNLVASIVLNGQSSLRTGNTVSIGTGTGAVRGKVADWDTRYLYLQSAEGHLVHVPNSIILNSIVILEKEVEDSALDDGARPQKRE